MMTAKREISKAAFLFFLASQIIFCVVSFPTAGLAMDVKLAWDAAEDGAAGYKIHYQGNSTALPFSETLDVASATEATINGLDPANSYYFAVTAYNSDGVESAYSNIFHVDESVPPVVTITSPSAANGINGTVIVTANAVDNVGVTSVEFYINNELKSTATSAPYSFDWNTNGASNGSYTLIVKAYDAAGNVGSSQKVLFVGTDTIPPHVSLISPVAGPVRGAVALAATASDDVAVSRVEFYANDTFLTATNLAPFTYTYDTSALPTGTYTITAKAFDAAGNNAISSVLVTVDNLSPAVAIVTPAPATTASRTVTVSANATDDIGVARVEFYVNDALQSTASSAPFTFSWNTANLSNGPYTLTTKAYDAAGNVGQAAVQVTVFNDHDAPTVSIAAPSVEGAVNGQVEVTATANDNVAVSKVEFYLDGVLFTTASAAPYTMAWDTKADANGTYTVTARAYDAAGNVGQANDLTLKVQNDQTAPVLSVNPLIGKTVSETRIISGQISDNVAVAKVVAQVGDNAPVEAVITDNTWNCAISNLAVGGNKVVVTATDTSGNSTQVTINVKRR